MPGRKIVVVAVVVLSLVPNQLQAQHGGGMHGSSWHGPHNGGGRHGGNGTFPVFVGGGGFFFGVSPVLVMGPGSFLPPMTWMGPSFLPARAPLMPPPPPGFLGPNGGIVGNKAIAKPSDPARSAQLTTLGDRLFRAGNLKKSEERYLQAMRAAPDLAAPRVRLAQVALARGHFADAAARFREAETAQPGWIVNAPDIQTIYGEPTEFARTLARLETYLQAHPDDRDGWLVLGAQLFLSGRTTKAADVFKRLDDPNRKSDVALAAFLDASNQAVRQPGRAPDPDDSLR
jgi:Tetratricopeptide repeat